MFSKCFFLSTITLFTLVHSIAYAAEYSANQPVTAKSPSRKRMLLSDVDGNVPNEDSLKPKPKTKCSRRRDLDAESKTNLDPVFVKSDDINDNLQVSDNFPKTSEFYQENSTPESLLREKPIEIGRRGSKTKSKKRNSKKAKNTMLAESRPKNEENDMTAQNESIPPPKEDKLNDNLVSFGGETSTLVTSGIEESGKIFNDNSPDAVPETIDGLEFIEEENREYESNQPSEEPFEEPLIMIIFKIISKSLGEMFSALKDVLQR